MLNYAEQQMSQGDWLLNNSCNKYAWMCSPHNWDLANSLATHWFTICREDRSISPRQLAVKKCPSLFSPEYQRRLQKIQFRRGF